MKTKKKEQAKCWTMIYNPFTMGGELTVPYYTMVNIWEKRTINGFDFFSFITPKSSVRICESQTGGIISSSFEALEKAMQGCTKEELQAQIDAARPNAERAIEMKPESFFKAYKY